MKYLLCLLLALPLALPRIGHAEKNSFADRDDVKVFITDMHQRHHFDCDEMVRLFDKATPLPAVIKAIQPPADPAVRSWQTYRSRFIEPRRIAAGVQFWQAHQASLAKAEALYGVPREIIVGIIGVETIYGKFTGRFQTFSALATLAFDYPPRAELFRRELEALLLLAREKKRDPLEFRGSFAGAIGLPQFLPSSMRQWAIDFDGDGKVDLATSPDDAIGSVANYLAAHGWQQDGTVLVAANADGPRIEELLAEGIKPKRTPDELVEFGVNAPNAPHDAVALIDYVTPDAPTTYRLGYNNFYVITRYNRSTFYATAVYELAQSVKESLKDAVGSEDNTQAPRQASVQFSP